MAIRSILNRKFYHLFMKDIYIKGAVVFYVENFSR